MRPLIASAILLSMLVPAVPALAQPAPDDMKIEATQVKPGIAVIYGQGGNIGVSYGPDGTILVDDQFAPLTDAIQKAVAGLGAAPTRFLINTHWHFDHAGGNENFGKAGALIFAQHNVRTRLAAGGEVAGRNVEPASPDALPVVTYDDGLILHVNSDTVDLVFLGGGHTDGDSAIFWRKANVLHTGDLFMKDLGFPFIDLSSGGNVGFLLNSLAELISMTDDETIIIPGHGKLATRADLVAFRLMVETAVDRVTKLKDAGMGLQAIKDETPLKGLRNGDGFVSDDQFVEAIWGSL